MIKDIYKLITLEQINNYICNNKNQNKLRNILLNEFDGLYDYKNIIEWNKLVTICEFLAIIGWGDREPVEAFANKWINGSYYTIIQNKCFETKKEIGWRKKNKSFIIEDGEDKNDYGINKFLSQRNLLPKSPIRFSKSGNYQKSVKTFYNKLEKLKDLLINKLQPEKYGSKFAYLGLNLNFSHHDDKNVRYEYFYSKNDVPKNYKGTYYIRPKFKIGNLIYINNQYKIVTNIHFTRKFGEMTFKDQKDIFKSDVYELLNIVDTKLEKKRINYNISLLKNDLENCFRLWI